METKTPPLRIRHLVFTALLLQLSPSALAADQELLNILLQNGAITQQQYDELLGADTLSSADILPETSVRYVDLEETVSTEVATQIDEQFPVTAEKVGSGFRFATRDGNWGLTCNGEPKHASRLPIAPIRVKFHHSMQKISLILRLVACE
jgi:hypothetical protein